jgi:hypothetical protein
VSSPSGAHDQILRERYYDKSANVRDRKGGKKKEMQLFIEYYR